MFVNVSVCVCVCLSVCVHIFVRMWAYIPGRWNGEVAAQMYRSPMRKVLAKHRATKKIWRIVQDNDPAGFRSSKARAAKKEVGMKEVSLPP